MILYSEISLNVITSNPDWTTITRLFQQYLGSNPGSIGEGLRYSSVPRWMTDREKAYNRFSPIFNSENLSNVEQVCKGYERWLLASNNKSWTNLQRLGHFALNKSDNLCELLGFIQDESIPIEERVYQGLVGKHKVDCVGKAILTGFFHTMFPEKYGVWNGSTEKAFKKLDINTAFTSKHVGETYVEINDMLVEMSSKVGYSITYVDGFMWYIATKLSSSLK